MRDEPKIEIGPDGEIEGLPMPPTRGRKHKPGAWRWVPWVMLAFVLAITMNVLLMAARDPFPPQILQTATAIQAANATTQARVIATATAQADLYTPLPLSVAPSGQVDAASAQAEVPLDGLGAARGVTAAGAASRTPGCQSRVGYQTVAPDALTAALRERVVPVRLARILAYGEIHVCIAGDRIISQDFTVLSYTPVITVEIDTRDTAWLGTFLPRIADAISVSLDGRVHAVELHAGPVPSAPIVRLDWSALQAALDAGETGAALVAAATG